MKSTDKPVRLFRYGRAAAGLILLVNPIISLYDILPDFIGYLLLFTALREVSRLEGRMEDAQSRLIWLAAFSGLRLTLALVFYDAQSSFKLLVCFSLAVVELVTFLMWSASFFSGLEYLLNRNDGEELVGRLSNVRFLTVLFFIVRSACNLLPEFTSLLEDAAMTDLTNAARYLALAGGKNLFILLGIVVVLVLGGFWLSGTLRFMKSAAGDARFSAALHRRYSEEGCDSPPRVRLRLLRSGFWAIIIGGAFFFDFTLDGTDVLPDVAGLLIICAGVLILSRIAPLRRVWLPGGRFALAWAAQAVYGAYFAPAGDRMSDAEALAAAVFATLTAVTALVFFRALAKDVAALTEPLIGVDVLPDFVYCTAPMAVFQSCAAAAAVFPALHAQLSFASFVFSLVWYFFLCRILFNIIGSYREVTGAGL